MASHTLEMSLGSPQVSNDIDSVAAAHSLTPHERAKLVAIVVGAISGNRDRPLIFLSKAIHKKVGGHSPADGILFHLLEDCQRPGKSQLSRLDGALLDFLASMDDFGHVEAIGAAVSELVGESDAHVASSRCARALARTVYEYRMRHLPFERYRGIFTQIARFLDRPGHASGQPEDGHALEFWRENASRKRWTLYETVLNAMSAYAEALELRGAAAPPGSWQDINEDGTDTYPWTETEQQAIASNSLSEILNLAHDTLSETSLNILKDKELKELKKLFRLGTRGGGWARGGLALLALAPHQASLVQLEKYKTELPRLAASARCEGGLTYGDVLVRLSEFVQVLQAVRDLVEDLEKSGSEADQIKTGSADSIVDSGRVLRDNRLMRRASFKALAPQELLRELKTILEQVIELQTYLSVVSRLWARRFEASADEAFAKDRAVFSAKLASLYVDGLVESDEQTGR